MQSGFIAHVTSAEWRWVIVVAVALVLLAFAPYGLLALSGMSNADWQFMGILHNSRDGAAYLGKILLGVNGEWFVQFQHTPEPHGSAFIQGVYPVLGQIVALTDIPPIVIFHIARVAAALFMYMTLYQLAATIWMRIRTRRIFFVLVSLAAGWGWLYAILTGGQVDAPDLTIPEAFPLQSSTVNVHFPFALACLALLVSVIIVAFRPGADHEPHVNNGGLVAVLASLGLGIMYPQGFVPLGGALVLFILLRWWRKKQIVLRELNWLLVIGLPVLPLAIYFGAIVFYNPAITEWMRQNITAAPPLIVMAIGLSWPLIIAAPAIYRSVRKFDSYDDRFMLIWLVVIVVAVYLPTNIQRRFALGLMIPIAYFATRAVDGFWFQQLSRRRWQYRALLFALPVIAITHLFVLFVPTIPVLINRFDQTQGLYLPGDYVGALKWVDENTEITDVVLASEVVSLWLPGWSGVRTVYGHDFETLYAAEKAQEVAAWYQDGSNCRELLEKYHVRYVLYGPEEAKEGDAPCLEDLQAVARSGDVTIYAP